MPDPTIRTAAISDAESLVDVYRSAYRENRRLGFPAKAESVERETVVEWIEAHHVFVAELDGAVVGGVRLEVSDPDRVKLSRLGVHDDLKGRGLGSRLVRFAEKWAREQGYRSIWLTTPEDHPYLPGFYRDRGYERTGEYPLEYRDYDEIVMEKRVD